MLVLETLFHLFYKEALEKGILEQLGEQPVNKSTLLREFLLLDTVDKKIYLNKDSLLRT